MSAYLSRVLVPLKRLQRTIAIWVCVGAWALPAAAVPIVNGGFETGDFTGWTLGGNTGFTFVAGAPVHSGSYAAHLGPIGSLGHLSQTLTGLTPGMPYQVSFWLAHDGGTPNSFSVNWGSSAFGVFTNLPVGLPYIPFSFVTPAPPSGNLTVTFNFQQDPAFWHLDDVSVTAVPEPMSVGLLGAGLISVAALVRRRRLE